ncbi:hypothetical protein wcw_1795 [Waddlia chondrophila WSU 86-1044]|uniref:Uncharacterized protein n=1 Tax=Waddlia chondrophila (strain ATCC VR-1470 / WSU 86-1044) TaxID=716544 RepID=D6YST9_WADCW|nr:hypothetical protein wcw_1795 [Waddlia chondrophila WSU 86-1044]
MLLNISSFHLQFPFIYQWIIEIKKYLSMKNF